MPDAPPDPRPLADGRYLLVKAHVGFGDRLQALSHALHHALKYRRTVCVDWTDSAWSDGAVDFGTFFDLVDVPTITPADLYALRFDGVSPKGWANQLARRADSKFIYKPQYVHTLPDADDPAQLVVYGSTGFRVYHVATLSLLRVKSPWRDTIVDELKRYAGHSTVVHLRGTDRVSADRHEAYLDGLAPQLADIPAGEPPLVVSDCLPLVERFLERRPDAVLRTPHLDRYDPAAGTHFQAAVPKADFNLQTLIDFFLIAYAKRCVCDGVSVFSQMARFLHAANDLTDLLGYDG